jgi:hypothetical protein
LFSLEHLLFKLFNYYCHFLITPSNWKKKYYCHCACHQNKVWLMAYDDSFHFQQYFSYIVVVSFIGGGNRNIRRKSPTCHNSSRNCIT